jgi:hypothetical protein
MGNPNVDYDYEDVASVDNIYLVRSFHLHDMDANGIPELIGAVQGYCSCRILLKLSTLRFLQFSDRLSCDFVEYLV